MLPLFQKGYPLSQTGNTLRKIEDNDPKIRSLSSKKIEDYDSFRSPRLKIKDYENRLVVLIVVLILALDSRFFVVLVVVLIVVNYQIGFSLASNRFS